MRQSSPRSSLLLPRSQITPLISTYCGMTKLMRKLGWKERERKKKAKTKVFPGSGGEYGRRCLPLCKKIKINLVV